MRILFIDNCNTSACPTCFGLQNLLVKSMETFGDIDVVNSSPDIVHMFGDWSESSVKKVKSFSNIGIPLVFSATEGLSSLLNRDGFPKKSIAHKRIVKEISQHAYIHCYGSTEDKLLRSIFSRLKSKVILNPEYTSLTNNENAATAFHDLYTSVYSSHELSIRKSIEGKISKVCKEQVTISEICFRLLYIKYLFKRSGIKQNYLDEVSRFMIDNGYDESLMREKLKALHLLKFASSCMSLLEQVSTLTEGFMPVVASNDKTTRSMRKLIIQ